MRTGLPRAFWVCLAAAQLFAQDSFEVVSLRASKANIGHDGAVTSDPGRLTIRNASLKRLIYEAYQIPYTQISGGPKWLDTQEFDLDAKASGPSTLPDMRNMLRKVLAERFQLLLQEQVQERKVYALLVAKGGSKLKTQSRADSDRGWRFRGDLTQFAGVLSGQLAIPLLEDPTRISRVTGPPVPVIDQTGIAGEFAIQLDIHPDGTQDSFTLWQRALQEQLGLKLESTKAPVRSLIVEHAALPTAN